MYLEFSEVRICMQLPILMNSQRLFIADLMTNLYMHGAALFCRVARSFELLHGSAIDFMEVLLPNFWIDFLHTCFVGMLYS